MIVTLDVSVAQILTSDITSRKAVVREKAFQRIRELVAQVDPNDKYSTYIDLSDFVYQLLDLPDFQNPDPKFYRVNPLFNQLMKDIDNFLIYFPKILAFVAVDHQDLDLLQRLSVAFSSFKKTKVIPSSLNIQEFIDSNRERGM